MMMRLVALLLVLPFTITAAVRFDGSDDVLHWDGAAPAMGAGLNFTNEITVAFWINKEAGLASAAEFIGKGRLKNGNNHQWSVRNSSEKFEFYFAAPSSTFHIFCTSSTYPSTNAWQHVAFRWQVGDSNTAQFFVNGERATGVWTTFPTNTVMLTNAEPMRIGTTYAGSTARASISEAAVWNAYLAHNEVRSLAVSRVADLPLTVRRQSLRAYWPLRNEFPHFSAASGTNRIRDMSGNLHHLTPLNSPQMRPGHLSEN
jgi:hypothetical protein